MNQNDLIPARDNLDAWQVGKRANMCFWYARANARSPRDTWRTMGILPNVVPLSPAQTV
ncbi:hypothetical protein ABAC402_03940 [Asticcacaulis sp. AC402]|nr:hypothetical protein ABAC402_03940 [Asticcacaulis sp. AC402]